MNLLNRLWPKRSKEEVTNPAKGGRGVADTRRWDPATPVLDLGGGESISLCRMMCGLCITGLTGSGKSGFTGHRTARELVRLGLGGMVLSVKNELDTWTALCREAGRLENLMVIEPGGKWMFNPIEHEITRSGPGGGAGYTENIVKLIGGLIDAAGRSTGQRSGRDNEAYWKQACEQLLRNAVDLLVAAKGRVSIPDLYRVVTSAPLSFEDVSSGLWAKSKGLCYRSLMEGHARANSPSQAEDFEVVGRYWVEEFPALSDKTRSSITSMFTASMDAFNRGVLKDLFCRESTITPEATEQGKIILVHLPVKSHGQIGLYANVVMKQAFQRSIERRPPESPAPRNSLRPVFLWADEGHYFLHAEDSLFQSTCRSSRVVSVLITQNIPNLDAALGTGDAGRAHAESLLANFGTLVFHCNTCQRTNELAANLIGRAPRFMVNGGTSQNNAEWTGSMLGLGGGGQSSSGFSEVMEHIVPPASFSRLACPSPGNGWRSEAVVVQSGSVFPRSGRTWKRVAFDPDKVQAR